MDVIEFGTILRGKFPDLHITEDVMNGDHYWINVRIHPGLWVVVESLPERSFGVSTVRGGGLDFSGHDKVFPNAEDVFLYVREQVAAFESV